MSVPYSGQRIAAPSGSVHVPATSLRKASPGTPSPFNLAQAASPGAWMWRRAGPSRLSATTI
jgi:hypothetical protein